MPPPSSCTSCLLICPQPLNLLPCHHWIPHPNISRFLNIHPSLPTGPPSHPHISPRPQTYTTPVYQSEHCVNLVLLWWSALWAADRQIGYNPLSATDGGPPRRPWGRWTLLYTCMHGTHTHIHALTKKEFSLEWNMYACMCFIRTRGCIKLVAAFNQLHVEADDEHQRQATTSSISQRHKCSCSCYKLFGDRRYVRFDLQLMSFTNK